MMELCDLGKALDSVELIKVHGVGEMVEGGGWRVEVVSFKI